MPSMTPPASASASALVARRMRIESSLATSMQYLAAQPPREPGARARCPRAKRATSSLSDVDGIPPRASGASALDERAQRLAVHPFVRGNSAQTGVLRRQTRVPLVGFPNGACDDLVPRRM